MATYFHGISASEIQSSADGLQTLYLMNPTYVPYSDALQHSTLPMHHTHALNLANLSHAPPTQTSPNHNRQQHHFIHGVPNILGFTPSDDHTRPYLFGHHHEIAAFDGYSSTPTGAPVPAPRVQHNLWGSVIDRPQPSPEEEAPTSSASAADDVSVFRRPSTQQGLSLCLSSQQTAYRSLPGEIEVPGVASGVGNSPASVSNGVNSSLQGVMLGSKYLTAAQEVLDEVVSVVSKGIYKEEFSEMENKVKVKVNRGELNNNGVGKEVVELNTAQRQELQMMKSKLLRMLDEMEQRYRQYHQQMQMVISSFEQAAGFGSAKSYTALALKTISKQFRCLKDAISSQVKATSKTLGEDDDCLLLGVKVVQGTRRLRYVDHHLRQQRALQQLGMIQPNAWRPQRGLPERAVSVLRAWLFEHFLHPYPKDSDKVMLAKQTGLTRSQVSNWFINARVRLWKPMVEEMYMEEIKGQENNNNNNGSDNISRSNESSKELGSTANASTPAESSATASVIKFDQIKINLQSSSKQLESSFNNNQNNSTSPTNSSILSTSPMGPGSLQSHTTGFHLAAELSDIMQRSQKKYRIGSEIMQNSPSSILSVDMEMKHGGNANINGGGSYGAFSMEDIGGRSSFNVSTGNGGVSLTLGLPHNENHLSFSGTQNGFLSQNENIHLGTNNATELCVMNTTPPASSHSGPSYHESIDIQNRKRFAAQLLPHFVT